MEKLHTFCSLVIKAVWLPFKRSQGKLVYIQYISMQLHFNAKLLQTTWCMLFWLLLSFNVQEWLRNTIYSPIPKIFPTHQLESGLLLLSAFNSLPFIVEMLDSRLSFTVLCSGISPTENHESYSHTLSLEWGWLRNGTIVFHQVQTQKLLTASTTDLCQRTYEGVCNITQQFHTDGNMGIPGVTKVANTAY